MVLLDKKEVPKKCALLINQLIINKKKKSTNEYLSKIYFL